MNTRAITLLMTGCLWAGVASAQMPQGTHAMPKSATTMKTTTTTKAAMAKKAAASAEAMKRCEAMAAEHDGMMTRMKLMDESLSRLVVAMNAADAVHKVDAMGAVVNELVVQRQAMQGMNSMMQGQMMSHMSEHMKTGAMGSMVDCPMMKSMGMMSAAR